MAEVAFLVNELRERDPGLAQKVESQIEQAAAEVEPGERLHCFLFVVTPTASVGGRALLRMRVGQMGWYRDFPPVPVEESPLAMGMAVGRLLRRHRRLRA
jgi:hypothetical protein